LASGPWSAELEPYCFRIPWLPPELMPNLYQNADIFAAPPIWQEPFGLVAVEAMATGLPVVASDVGGLRDIVTDGETGYLFANGNFIELADKLEKLLDDADLRMKMGTAGRRRVKNSYDWSVVMKRYENIFKQ